jgi:hypothetical protein
VDSDTGAIVPEHRGQHDRDHSQPLRVTVQILFAILNVWIGVQFYLWVRWAESGGRTFEVSRPAGVEGWLPIEDLMQLKYKWS